MDATDEEQETRRERLRQWVAACGGHAEVCRTRRLTKSQASYLSQIMNGYSFGPRSARGWESRLGMSQRYLESGDRPEAIVPVLDDAARIVDAILRMSPLRWASVRTQLDMLAERPEMRDDVLAELRALLGAPSTKRQSSGEH